MSAVVSVLTQGVELVPRTSAPVANYNANLWSCRTAAGNRLVAFAGGDGVTPATHETNKRAWLIRNEGEPELIFDGASIAPYTNMQQWFPLELDGLLFAVLMVDTSTLEPAGLMWSVSADEGVTWSAPAAATLPPDFTSTLVEMMDFCPSLDGKMLCTPYQTTAGSGGDYWAACCETTNGQSYTRRGWMTQGNPGIGNEASLTRLPSDRLLSVVRSTAVVTGAYTTYSDDDGYTWSEPTLRAGLYAQGQHGVAVGADRVWVYGRYYTGSGWPYAAHWVLDADGALVSGPHYEERLDSRKTGGYATIIETPAGQRRYQYTDYGINGTWTGITVSELTLTEVTALPSIQFGEQRF